METTTDYVVGLLQRIDLCDQRFTPDEREQLKRAVLSFFADDTRSACRLERKAVMDVVRRHVHSSHFLRVQAHVDSDAKTRRME